MRRVDFYEFPRPVQDRFIACVRGEGEPVPLLSLRAGVPRQLFVFTAVAAAGALGLYLLFQWGFGELGGRFSLQPAALIALYAAAGAALALGILRVAHQLRDAAQLPFPAGVYLFPSGVVDARRHRLVTFSLTSVVEATPSKGAFQVTFADGASFGFPVRDRARADQVDGALRKAKEALIEALSAEDRRRIGQLDPLHDIGVANPFAPKASIAPGTPMWARAAWIVAAASGAVVAPALWYVRNLASEAAMFQRAEREHTVDAYRAYLASGGRRAEVAEVLLPRAELALAVQQGSVAGIEAYMNEHPGTRIGDEVTSALRDAMLSELETVKKAGTVSALTDFARRHPRNMVDAELREAVHGVYQVALATYKKESGVKDPAVIAFMESLLTAAEKTGPRVPLRFRRKVARSMEIADSRVKKNHYFMGTPSIPSQYFDEAHARVREAAAGQVLIDRFASAFPADVLALEMGPPLEESEAPAARTTAMLIEHTAEPSAAPYTTTRPRGVFVGVGFTFDASWVVPGAAKPLQFHTSVWRPPSTSAAKGADPLEPAVYEAMAQSGFSNFTRKYLALFFPKGDLATSN